MSITEFGALGEGIGSLLILITLIYLAVQNRHQQKLLLSQAYQTRNEMSKSISELLIPQADLTEAVLRKVYGSSYSDSDKDEFLLMSVLSVALRVGENTHYQQELGIISEDQLRGSAEGIKIWLRFEGATSWMALRQTYGNSFSQWVDSLMQEIEQEEATA